VRMRGPNARWSSPHTGGDREPSRSLLCDRLAKQRLGLLQMRLELLAEALDPLLRCFKPRIKIPKDGGCEPGGHRTARGTLLPSLDSHSSQRA